MMGESLAVQLNHGRQITIGEPGKEIGYLVNHQFQRRSPKQHAKYLAPSQLCRCQHEHYLYAAGQKR
eukprot:COSAG02_NODE_50107_length_322_cov_1.349776_1_plen_66_part_10